MSSIKIKNFGPIGEGNVENDGWIDISRVTVFIGEQGSGKSTVAKLISTFSWIEKDLFRSDGSTLRFRKQERIFKKYLEYHRISSYLKDSTEIEYDGEAYHICYTKGNNLEITPKQPSYYQLPKITYYPAERNFISSIKSVRSEVNLRIKETLAYFFKYNDRKEFAKVRAWIANKQLTNQNYWPQIKQFRADTGLVLYIQKSLSLPQ